jgi:hypothetical protein
MLKQLALTTALIASFGTAHAYQAEINANYENTSFDGDSEDLDTFGIDGTYYLNGVKSKIRHLQRLLLKAKASNIGLGYANSSIDEDGAEEIDTVGLNGEYFIPNSQFYVSGSLNRSEVTVESEFGKASDDNVGYALEAGYLPVDGLLIAAGVAKENLDPMYVSKNGFIDTFSNISAVADDTAVTLRAKYVTQIGNLLPILKVQHTLAMKLLTA